MKTLVISVCILALMGTPLLGAAEEGERAVGRGMEGVRHAGEESVSLGSALLRSGHALKDTAVEGVKLGAGVAVEHPVPTVAVGTAVGLHPAGHKPVALIPATAGHAGSGWAAALTTGAIVGVFVAILAWHIVNYQELNRHPAFEGQDWDTCANAIYGSVMARQCYRRGFLSHG